MHTRDFAETLATLFAELNEGLSGRAYILNRGDVGMLGSLDALSAEAASARTQTGSTIAAHVDHVRYGLSLMNRWAAGEDPFQDADWGASWKKKTVTDDEWRNLRAALRQEAADWLQVLRTPRDVTEMELHAIIGSIAHLAYHLGAIRQINSSLRGPVEPG